MPQVLTTDMVRLLPCHILLLLSLVVVPGLASAQEKDAEQGQGNRDTSVDSPDPDPRSVDPRRFGKVPDKAFGAFQRGRYLTALELALPRANAGDAAAQTLVAEIYANGFGVPRDAEKAAEWYAKAAEQGDPAAELQYALMLLDGNFVDEDRDRAFILMRRAAESGKALAQFNLAQMLMQAGTPDAEKEAVIWYERAANARLADAQYAMAQIYANGLGGKEPDDEEARRWLLLAARQNFDTAQLDLGTWLVEGRGGEVDSEQGFAWLKRAAEGGNVAAQNRVAKLYRAGVGVEGDPIAAAAWYISARRAGLRDHEMEDFMAGLTDEQLQAAVKQANTLQ